MDRFNFFFRQKVAEAELDAAFDAAEVGLSNFVEAFNYIGIGDGAVASEHSPNNLTIDLSGPAKIYDQSAQLIKWSATQNLDVSLDENGASTAVVSSGNERYVSVFAEFTRALSDSRTDGDGNQVFFSSAESFNLNVVAGNEVVAASATPPALRADQILLCDILLAHNQTAITDSDIDVSRAQVVFDLTGSPTSIRQRNLQSVLQDMLDDINGFVTTTLTLDQSDTDAARINSTLQASNFLNIFEFKYDATRYVRMYASTTSVSWILPGLWITLNAKWETTGTQWERDDTGNAYAASFNNTGQLQLHRHTNTATPWGETEWDELMNSIEPYMIGLLDASTSGGGAGAAYTVQGQDATGSNQDGGDIVFETGAPTGTGLEGTVYRLTDNGDYIGMG